MTSRSTTSFTSAKSMTMPRSPTGPSTVMSSRYEWPCRLRHLPSCHGNWCAASKWKVRVTEVRIGFQGSYLAMVNRLANETSPYLRQHRDNPVDWYPWGDEAFTRAGAEDKPVLLSVGYSACHWCHVMAHESFEDPEVAAAMNERFVSIKVDREERPDVDAVYM